MRGDDRRPYDILTTATHTLNYEDKPCSISVFLKEKGSFYLNKVPTVPTNSTGVLLTCKKPNKRNGLRMPWGPDAKTAFDIAMGIAGWIDADSVPCQLENSDEESEDIS